jgi:Right handed beta helix region
MAAVVLVASIAGTACATGSQRPADPTAVLRPPRLAGAALVGHRLQVSRGVWAVRPTAFRFRWQRCLPPDSRCNRIAGATREHYRLTGRDLGSRVRALVIAVVHGRSLDARSSPTARIHVRPLASSCTGIRVIPGADVAGLVSSAPPGSTFCFRRGRYRIRSTVVPLAGDRLIGQPGAILDAAVVVRGWHRTGSLWVAATGRTTPTFNYGGGYNGSYRHPQAVYADDVFEDKRPLQKIGVRYHGVTVGAGPSALRPGQYFYDYDAGQVLLAANPAHHRLELESLPGGVIHGTAPAVTVRGLTVQGSLGDGIVTGSGADWRVIGNNVRLNHSEGVRVTTGGRVVRNDIHANGTYGIAATGDSMLIHANEVAGNNTARYMTGDGQCADAGGSKITNSRGVTLDRNWYHGNHCIGIWFDIDDDAVTIAHNLVNRNAQNGIDVEISYHALIAHNVVTKSSHWGILDSASPHVTIVDNAVAGNADGSVVITQGPRTDSPSPYGPHYARDVRVVGNRILMSTGRAGALQEGVTGTPFDGVVFSPTNRFSANHYLLANPTHRWFEWSGGPVTIAGWRSLGQDAGSTFRRQ